MMQITRRLMFGLAASALLAATATAPAAAVVLVLGVLAANRRRATLGSALVATVGLDARRRSGRGG